MDAPASDPPPSPALASFVSTLAGDGVNGHRDGHGAIGAASDDAVGCQLALPCGIVEERGTTNLYIAEYDTHCIRKIDRSGPVDVVTTIAGKPGERGFADGKGRAARFNYPTGLAITETGLLIVADRSNHRIRSVDPATGEVRTVAGTGEVEEDDGPACTVASFYEPNGVAVDHKGAVLVADNGNHKIRSISSYDGQGTVTTVAGTGVKGSRNGGSGDAEFSYPSDVAVDHDNTLFIADSGNYCIRKISGVGSARGVTVSTLAGAGPGNPGQKDGVGSEARFYYPHALAVDGDGNCVVCEKGNHAIR